MKFKRKNVEHPARSELAHQACQTYFEIRAQFVEEKATLADLRALREARRDMERGETVPVEKALRELHSLSRQARH